jgi:hypothetical protein
VGNLDQEARAMDGLAGIRLTGGRADLARQLWCQALDRYTELDVPEAEEVRRRLAALDAASMAAVQD